MNTQQSMKEAAALPGWFKDHPIAKAILKEQADGILKQRTAARKEIDKLQKEAAGLIPGMKAAITDAESEFEFWEDQGRTLKRKHSAAAAALSAVKFTLARGIQKQEGVLLTSYDERIDDAIEIFRETLDRLRLPNATQSLKFKRTLKSAENGKQEVYRSTNRPAVMEAIDYTREAIEELERMRLSPECDVVRIEALKTGIPSIDAFTESEAYERVIPD